MESIIAIIFSLLIGGAALAIGLNTMRVNRRVKRWPTVEGTLVDRDVVPSTGGSVTNSGPRYQAKVTYTYEVAGQSYAGDKIVAYGNITGSREAMQQEVDGFSDRLAVRYNPENPADSCLKAQPSWWAFGALAGAALCFLVGLITLTTLVSPGK